ncbi:MAG: phosphatidate cytidylyltransferase, partial [Planctomycetota bacterium]
MMRQRILFGAALIGVLLGLLYLDDRFAGPLELGTRSIRHEGAIVTLILAVICIIGTIEFARITDAAGHNALRLWAAVSNYLLILLPYFTHNGLLGATAPTTTNAGWLLTWLIIALFGSCTLVAARQRTEHAISDIAVTILMVLYLGILPTYLLRLRLEGSAWLLLYFIATTKSCDIGAYFTGCLLGRHKLIEWLSPKKTVEGLLGGVLFSIGVSILLSQWIGVSMGHGQLLQIPLSLAALFGLLMAVVGQAGD